MILDWEWKNVGITVLRDVPDRHFEKFPHRFSPIKAAPDVLADLVERFRAVGFLDSTTAQQYVETLYGPRCLRGIGIRLPNPEPSDFLNRVNLDRPAVVSVPDHVQLSMSIFARTAGLCQCPQGRDVDPRASRRQHPHLLSNGDVIKDLYPLQRQRGAGDPHRPLSDSA